MKAIMLAITLAVASASLAACKTVEGNASWKNDALNNTAQGGANDGGM